MPSIDDFPGFLDEEALKDETLKRAQTKAKQILEETCQRLRDEGKPPLNADSEAIILLGRMFVEAVKDLGPRVARLEIASGKALASKVEVPKGGNNPLK